jgi:Fic family protein
MTYYIHELADWPNFQWDKGRLAAPLAAARHRQGRLVGQMEALGFRLREEAVLRTLTEDVLKSSEIEGEKLDADQVRSSVARRLGLDVGGLRAADRHVEGVVEMMLDATQRFDQPLTAERLFGWHASLFPTGRSGMHRISVGAWRDDKTAPMQVVSGPVGRERVHFEAPAAERLEDEMRQFLEWFNTDGSAEPVLKAALAHLWFVTIHPFDDGNGRIARAIADMSLARSEGSPQRFYSMSAQIREERGEYYGILERTQKGTMDATPWMEWFLACLTRAIEGAQAALSGVVEKARYWEKLRDVAMNERQRLVISKLLEGFDGKLTTSKWAALTKSSADTALRDIQQLVERGVLVRNSAGGRSTSYSLATPGPSRLRTDQAES